MLGHDLFAHDVKLGLKEGNDCHATLTGSIFSLFIKFLMIIYVRGLIFQAITHDADTNDMLVDYLDLSQEDPVSIE